MTSEALKYYENALGIAQEMGNLREKGYLNWNMSLAAERLDDFVQMEAHAEAALTILREIDDPNVEKVRKQLAEWRSKRK
mgnify:FL=1